MIFEFGFVCRGELRGCLILIFVLDVLGVVVPGFRCSGRGRAGRRGGRIIKGRFSRWRDNSNCCLRLRLRLRVKGGRSVCANEILPKGVKLVVKGNLGNFGNFGNFGILKMGGDP